MERVGYRPTETRIKQSDWAAVEYSSIEIANDGLERPAMVVSMVVVVARTELSIPPRTVKIDRDRRTETQTDR